MIKDLLKLFFLYHRQQKILKLHKKEKNRFQNGKIDQSAYISLLDTLIKELKQIIRHKQLIEAKYLKW